MSNTNDDTLIQAIEYLKENLDPSIPELPVEDAPVDFVPDDWDKHVFTRQRSTRKVLSISKSMYELCIIDQYEAIHGVIRSEYIQKYYDDMLRILASFHEWIASPAHILLKIAALRNTNSLKIAAFEMGKVCRSIFLLKISINQDMRIEIHHEFFKVERWHEFGDNVFIGHGGKLQEDSLEEQYRTL